jgi:hypothetical protein
MRSAALVVFAIALPLAGCLLTTGQIVIAFDLRDPLDVLGPTAVVAAAVDLNTVEEFEKHKDNLAAIADAALLGEIENTGGVPVGVEIWMTPGITSHVTAAAVRSDPNAIQVWGPLTIGVGESHRLGWDDSAELFVGRQALIDEVKGDGIFTLYTLGQSSAATYRFRVHQGTLVVVLDGGL